MLGKHNDTTDRTEYVKKDIWDYVARIGTWLIVAAITSIWIYAIIFRR